MAARQWAQAPSNFASAHFSIHEVAEEDEEHEDVKATAGSPSEAAEAYILPPEVADMPEVHESFCETNEAYPMSGRPFGLAMVWGSSYQDDNGNVTLMYATDSANAMAEVLQQTGFEVRVRHNLRRKYVLDELHADNIGDEIRTKYDMILIYFCGRGDGDSFMTQYNERITVKEIWKHLDDAGMRDKPRVMIMDLFDMKSNYVEEMTEDLNLLQFEVAGGRQDVELMMTKGQDVPERMMEQLKKREEMMNEKRRQLDALRKAPSAGMQARVAILGVPITEGIARWTFHVKSVNYAISFGVCNPAELCNVQGTSMLQEYTGVCDFLGSDRNSWAFNQMGRAFHNEHEKPGKAHWGKTVNVREGDLVTITLDCVSGVMRMDVPEKFKGTSTKLANPQFVKPRDKGLKLYPAVALYSIDDAIEVESFKVGTQDAGPNEDMKSYGGRMAWDKTSSGPGLRFEGRTVIRGEGLNLPNDPHSCILVSRQPCVLAPRSYSDRGAPIGEMFISVYDAEPPDTEGISLFSHLFRERMLNARRDASGNCFMREAFEGIREEMNKYALTTWLKTQSPLQGRSLINVVTSLMSTNCTVDSLKYVVDKGTLDDHGIKNRSIMDMVYKAIQQARNESTFKVQSLTLMQHYTLQKNLLFNGPSLAWSFRHKSFNLNCVGDMVTKEGQSVVSCVAMCSLESELRSPRAYGALLSGGGKHSWTWTIERLRSSQATDDADTRQPGTVRLGIVMTEVVKSGRYARAFGHCRGGSTTTVMLDPATSSSVDGYYEGMQVVLTSGRGSGQVSRIFGYTAEDHTIDVMLEVEPDLTSRYFITLLEGFEIGDDEFSWGLSSSTAGRSAAMHGNPQVASFKAFKFQGEPISVNRVTSAGYEMANTYPRFLGNRIVEGDEVTAYLDLEGKSMSFTVNGERLGDPILGVQGPVIPAISVSSVTDCSVRISNYRRWAPNTGWAAGDDDGQMGFDEEELLELKQAFRQYEQNGAILLHELRDLLTSLGWTGTDAEMSQIMDDVDIDGSGSLDQTEFFQLIAGMKEEGTWYLGLAQDVSRRKLANA